jgi:hypothetical protein
MKKMLYLFSCALLMLYVACFEGDDVSRVIVAASAPASVAHVHLAIYDTTISDDHLLEFRDFAPSSELTLEIEAGDKRIFIIWAENDSGLVDQMGTTTIDLQAGTTVDVNISMYQFASLINMGNTGNIITWDAIPGAEEYELQYDSVFDENFVTYYIGENNWYDLGGYIQSYIRVRVYSSVFALKSVWSNYYSY